jgi:hypothetical protein
MNYYRCKTNISSNKGLYFTKDIIYPMHDYRLLDNNGEYRKFNIQDRKEFFEKVNTKGDFWQHEVKKNHPKSVLITKHSITRMGLFYDIDLTGEMSKLSLDVNSKKEAWRGAYFLINRPNPPSQ